jgi:hypothetical protein
MNLRTSEPLTRVFRSLCSICQHAGAGCRRRAPAIGCAGTGFRRATYRSCFVRRRGPVLPLSCRLSGVVRRGVRRVQHDAPGVVGRLESGERAAAQALAHGLGGQAEDAGGGDQVDAVLLAIRGSTVPIPSPPRAHRSVNQIERGTIATLASASSSGRRDKMRNALPR